MDHDHDVFSCFLCFFFDSNVYNWLLLYRILYFYERFVSQIGCLEPLRREWLLFILIFDFLTFGKHVEGIRKWSNLKYNNIDIVFTWSQLWLTLLDFVDTALFYKSKLSGKHLALNKFECHHFYQKTFAHFMSLSHSDNSCKICMGMRHILSLQNPVLEEQMKRGDTLCSFLLYCKDPH